MTYTLYFTGEAKKDLAGLKKNEPAAFKKATALLKELQEHPRTGTGKPKPLGYGYKDFFSRRITQKHRLVYSINDEKITVLVVIASGHYHDK
jgi:toxin YoeB